MIYVYGIIASPLESKSLAWISCTYSPFLMPDADAAYASWEEKLVCVLVVYPAQ